MNTLISNLFLGHQFDWQNLKDLKANTRFIMKAFVKLVNDNEHVCIQEFKGEVGEGIFLMPIYIAWRKIIDNEDIFLSSTLSSKRKKLIKLALKKSQQLGIRYQVENLVTEEKFKQFLEFYNGFMESMNYEKLLTMEYFQTRESAKMFLINIFDKDNIYLGGRLIYKYHNKLSTEYRAVKRTKLIREGYDIVCEKIYYDIAVAQQIKILGRGREINLRGINNRKIGILFNKLKYGYRPYLLRQFPRVYMDLNFLRNSNFDVVFFISLDQTFPIKISKEEKLIFNFIIGKEANKHLLEELMNLKERLKADIRIYDKSFQLLKFSDFNF